MMETTRFRTISESELVEYLLDLTGQADTTLVDPAPILNYLSLKYLAVNFSLELPEVLTENAESPRAILSVPDQVVAVSNTLSFERIRFSTFHEVGHYVLPEHVGNIVLCNDGDMSYHTQRIQEQQANAFAANLLFHGEQFTQQANSREISAATVADLARCYRASFEATARRLVEKNFRPCALTAYKKVQHGVLFDDVEWKQMYWVASPAFRHRYDGDVTFDPHPLDFIMETSRDITDSVISEAQLVLSDGRKIVLQAEYFTNQYCAFILLLPMPS